MSAWLHLDPASRIFPKQLMFSVQIGAVAVGGFRTVTASAKIDIRILLERRRQAECW
jgi:hypothetical protein